VFCTQQCTPFDRNKKKTGSVTIRPNNPSMCYYYSWVISDNEAAVINTFSLIIKAKKLLAAKKRKVKVFF
jgi:hypothetical protein